MARIRLEIPGLPSGIDFGIKGDVATIKQYDKNNNIVRSFECVDGSVLSVDENNMLSTKTSNFVFRDVENWPLEYSLEGLAYADLDTSRFKALYECFMLNANNNTITGFLLVMFIFGLGDAEGISYYDKKGGNIINADTYYDILLNRVAMEIGRPENVKIKNAYNERAKEIKNHFNDIKNVLIKAGWKEHTKFHENTIKRFKSIIINRKYARQ
jgi:hypothetical protein